MWPDRVSNPGHLTYESGAPPTALRGPAGFTKVICIFEKCVKILLGLQLATTTMSTN